MIAALRTRLATNPVAFFMALTFINMFGFAAWSALLNNFAKEVAQFSGKDIGLLQTVREIPGFLAFTAIYWTVVMREQTLAYASLLLLGFGIAITGYFPTVSGMLMTTFIMSVGFHYFETMNQSLSLQLLPKKDAPRLLGKIQGAGAIAQFIAYGGIALFWWSGERHFDVLFLICGGIATLITVLMMAFFKNFQGTVPQHKTIILRRRYWLYYALTFMSGARRQIFTAFAAFLLVESFKFSVAGIAVLMLITAAFNTVTAPKLGALVNRIGERPTIIFENIVLVLVFSGYALAYHGHLPASAAPLLYILDGVFFTLNIAQRTYFQKIGDAADMAPTAAVAFTINHIAAVFIPVTFGLIWLRDPSMVFIIGAGIAIGSLILACFVPHDPGPGRETIFEGGEPEVKGAAVAA